MPDVKPTLRILSIVEATNINAVAKGVLEFYRSARELNQTVPEFPSIEGCAVTFDRRRDYHGPPNDFVTAASELGLDVELIPEGRRFDLSVIPSLRRIVESRQPDVLVTNSVKSHFILWRSWLWQEYPWVAFHHGYTSTDLKMRVYNHLDRWSLPKADRVVTVCNAFVQKLLSMGVPREHLRVQHNSIRPQPTVSAPQESALRKQLGIKEDERMILAVGRLSKEKAQIDLLRAFHKLSDTHAEINARLVIVGDGPERENLEATAASLGVNDRVVFTGQVREIAVYYASADVLVNPSHSEGSPYVLLEAMAAKLPIVATAVGGVPEMVENNQTALLVPASDPQAMADAIARVLSDEQLAQRLSAGASTLSSLRFSPESYARSLTEIYREVISSRTV